MRILAWISGGVFCWVLLPLAIVLASLFSRANRKQYLIQQWAAKQGLRLIECDERRIARGPYFWTTLIGQAVYRIVVEFPDRHIASGWVRCGSWAWFLGVFSYEAEVRWDAEPQGFPVVMPEKETMKMAANDIVQVMAATAADVPIILDLIRGLAEYEKLSTEVVASEELLHQHLFGPKPVAEVRIAWLRNEAVGFALYFHNFSTFLGRPGIYLEDIYVRPEFRGKGIGKALLKEVARVAAERKCGRLEWSVLDWNEPAIRFYKSLGAKPMSEWTVYRMTAEAIEKLAES